MEAFAKEVERCEVHYWHMGDGRCSCPHDCDNCGVTYVGGHSKDECITVLKNRLKLDDLANRIKTLEAGQEPMSRDAQMAAAKADVLANLSKAPIIKDYDPPLVVSRIFNDGCEFKGETKSSEIMSTPYELVSHEEVLKVVCPLCHSGVGQVCKYDTGEDYSGIHLRRHAKAYLSLRKQADERVAALVANTRRISVVIAYPSGVLEGIYESEDDAKEFCRLHPRCEYRTGTVTPSSPDECEGGEPCWFNRETGYREYCPKHEAIIADKAMETDAKRKTAAAISTDPDFVHEDDCPCFGDATPHSIDCANCTCDKPCKLPPEGWVCSRQFGHDGPCAARPRKLYREPLTHDYVQKVFSYQHRHSDYHPSYYRLSSPSGLKLCLTDCDKDTEAFIAEANAALIENQRLRAILDESAEK